MNQQNEKNNNDWQKEVTITLKKWQVNLLSGSVNLHAFLESFGAAMWYDVGGSIHGIAEYEREMELCEIHEVLNDKIGDIEATFGYFKPRDLKQIFESKEAQYLAKKILWEGAAHFRVDDNAPKYMTFDQYIKGYEAWKEAEELVRAMSKLKPKEKEKPN